MRDQNQQQHSSKTPPPPKTATKNILKGKMSKHRGKSVKAKNVKTKRTASASGKRKKAKEIDSDKSTKYQSDQKSDGQNRMKTPPGERGNASREGRRNRGISLSKNSSQRSERTSRT